MMNQKKAVVSPNLKKLANSTIHDIPFGGTTTKFPQTAKNGDAPLAESLRKLKLTFKEFPRIGENIQSRYTVKPEPGGTFYQKIVNKNLEEIKDLKR